MYGDNFRIGFWTALAVALGGAALTHYGAAAAIAPAPVWAETLRPLLITATWVALATAATLAYGGGAERGQPPRSQPRFERPALWTVAISLISLLLFVR